MSMISETITMTPATSRDSCPTWTVTTRCGPQVAAPARTVSSFVSSPPWTWVTVIAGAIANSTALRRIGDRPHLWRGAGGDDVPSQGERSRTRALMMHARPGWRAAEWFRGALVVRHTGKRRALLEQARCSGLSPSAATFIRDPKLNGNRALRKRRTTSRRARAPLPASLPTPCHCGCSRAGREKGNLPF
jgi:hypothetical protein